MATMSSGSSLMLALSFLDKKTIVHSFAFCSIITGALGPSGDKTLGVTCGLREHQTIALSSACNRSPEEGTLYMWGVCPKSGVATKNPKVCASRHLHFTRGTLCHCSPVPPLRPPATNAPFLRDNFSDLNSCCSISHRATNTRSRPFSRLSTTRSAKGQRARLHDPARWISVCV